MLFAHTDVFKFDYMEQSSSRKTNSYTGGEEINYLLWNYNIQEPTTCSCPEPSESTSHNHIPVLILSFHLHMGLILLGFSTKIQHAFLILTIYAVGYVLFISFSIT